MKTAILTLALAICGTVYAQSPMNRGALKVKSSEEREHIMRERIETQKVAYITEKLTLTPTEAKAFWPVYNEYRAEKEMMLEDKSEYALNSRYAEEEEDEKSTVETITADQLDEHMATRFARQREKIDLDEKYYGKYKEVLPIEKVARLYKAERSFKREMMRKMRDRKDSGEDGSSKDYDRRQMRQREAR